MIGELNGNKGKSRGTRNCGSAGSPRNARPYGPQGMTTVLFLCQ